MSADILLLFSKEIVLYSGHKAAYLLPPFGHFMSPNRSVEVFFSRTCSLVLPLRFWLSQSVFHSNNENDLLFLLLTTFW